jgi:hypothetical protein
MYKKKVKDFNQINIDINIIQTSSFKISWWQGVLDTTLYDKVCQ